MAVNNLLSRDDESDLNASSGPVGVTGGEEWEDEPEDLLSFFEHPESHLLLESEACFEDVLFDRPSSPRLRNDLTSDYGQFQICF